MTLPRLLLTTSLALCAGWGGAPRTDLHGDPLPEHALARLGSSRFAHGWPCPAVALSPDDKILASADAPEGGVHFWDVATGKELGRVRGMPPRESSMTFSPNGKTFAFLDGRGSLWSCEVPGGKLRQTRLTNGREGDVCLRFSPDGKLLATSGWDNDVRLWDAQSGAAVRQLRGHTERVWHLAFTPDGKHLASAGNDSTVRVWDTDAGVGVRRLQGHPDVVYGLAFSPDGKTLASCGVASPVLLWDWAAGKETGRLDAGTARACYVAFFPDGKEILTLSSEDGHARVWDATTRRERRRFPVTIPYAFKKFLLAGGGKFLVVADTWARFWDPATGKEIPRFGHGGGVVAFSPDGRTVATGFAGDLSRAPSLIRLWDAGSGKELGRLEGHRAAVRALAFRQGGQRLESYAADRTLCLWDLAAKQEIARRQLPDRSYRAVLAGGGTLLVENTASRTVLRDAATNQELRVLDRPDRATVAPWWSVIVSRDGARVVAAGELAGVVIGRGVKNPGTFCVWDARTGKLLQQSDTADAITAIALSPSGEMLAIADAGETVGLWSTRTGKLVRPIHEARGQFEALQFSPDGRFLAGAGPGREVLLWEVATGKEVRRMHGHRAKVVGLDFSPDGKKLASGSWDGTTLIWDVGGALTPRRALTPDELNRCWDALADDDPRTAYSAVWALAADPDRSVPFLRPKVEAHAGHVKQIRRLVAELDHPKYSVRQEALRELTRLGDAAAPALRKVLDGNASLEARRRAEIILKNAGTPTPERLQVLRMLAVLDCVGSREARELLKAAAD